MAEPFTFDCETGCDIDAKTGVPQKADSPAIGDSAVAVERFWQVLAQARWGSLMFGVIRHEIQRQARLMPNFAGGDRAMLSELALSGRFPSSRECLFLQRLPRERILGAQPKGVEKLPQHGRKALLAAGTTAEGILSCTKR